MDQGNDSARGGAVIRCGVGWWRMTLTPALAQRERGLDAGFCSLRPAPSPRLSPEGRGSGHQVVNEVPQPQEDFAFGFSNLKPAPVTDVT